MAIGAAGKQGQFEDAAMVLGDRLKAGSLYRLLADEGHRLFPDDYFADLFMSTPCGRPTIPARTVATVMLLQSFEGLSNREACDRLAFELRRRLRGAVRVPGTGRADPGQGGSAVG